MAENTGLPDGVPAESRGRLTLAGVHPRRTISALLVLLVAIAIAPILAFSIVLLQSNARAQMEVVDTLAEAATNSIAESVEREITGMITTLRVISTAPSLREGRIRELYDWARSSLAGSGGHLILVDPGFNQIFNTRVPIGQALGQTSNPAAVQHAVDSRQPVISDIFFGRTAQTWVFNVVMPVPEEGRVPALILTQNAENLQRLLQQGRSGNGWSTALLDRGGKVLASTSGSTEIAQPFFLDLDLQSHTDPEHFWKTVGERDYEVVISPSPSSGWWVVSWISSQDASRSTRRALLLLLVGGGIVIAVVMLAALYLARQIARSVRGLALDAKRLGTGELVEMRTYPVAEVNVVAQALADASRERQSAENEIRFLMREVAHRSKNQLTVVSSIAKQSARNATSFPDFQESFQKRIQGLARSTDLLIAGGVGGVELRDLVCAQLEPFRPDSASRLSIKGPVFRLGHHTAQTLGMAFHELATNAAKYGAFAGGSGRIDVNWTLSAEQLTLRWRETVAGLEKPAERRGFGTEVIERMVGRALDAEITRTMHEDGLEWVFVIPLARLEQDAPAESGAERA
ncbi:MAG TPA: sensor histidine kinase [Tianweitania sediminis]|nr:sensor histidine kinase [Tianweitania sediminis]